MSEYYIEPSRELNIYGEYDVVIVGGGTSGVFAAIAAAWSGKSVLIVEQLGGLGGSSSAGLVTPLMHNNIKGNPFCSYIALEVNALLEKYNGVNLRDGKNARDFDPIVLGIVFEELCVKNGVNILLHTFFSDSIVENGVVKGIIIENKAGRQVVFGKVFIDCTGDGDLCVRSGAEYMKGDADTGKNQPMSLRYVISGVDNEKFAAHIDELEKKTGLGGGYSWLPALGVDRRREYSATHLVDEAIKNGDLEEEDSFYWTVGSLANRTGSLSVNSPEFFDRLDAVDPDVLTFTQLDGKRRIQKQLMFCKKYLKGFDNAYVSSISSMVGIRESRRIKTKYVITGEELLMQKKFEDSYCRSNYPVDIHGKKLNFDEKTRQNDDGLPYFELPFGTLVVSGFDNLLVAGRCIGADFIAQSAIRVQQSVRSSGEAAGIAASMMIDDNVTSNEIDGRLVRAEMERRGAEFSVIE